MLIYKELDEGRSHQSVRSYQFVFLTVLLQRFLSKLPALLRRIRMNCSWNTIFPKNPGIYQKGIHLPSVGECPDEETASSWKLLLPQSGELLLCTEA